jgi:hypothetical protein
MTNSIIETLLERGQTEPYHHAVSRPSIAEAEATVRLPYYSTSIIPAEYLSI